MDRPFRFPEDVPADTFCTEAHLGPTPNGGVFSTAYYSNKLHEPCCKEDAAYMEISEIDEHGVRVGGVYAFCGEEENRKFSEEERDYLDKNNIQYHISFY